MGSGIKCRLVILTIDILNVIGPTGFHSKNIFKMLWYLLYLYINLSHPTYSLSATGIFLGEDWLRQVNNQKVGNFTAIAEMCQQKQPLNNVCKTALPAFKKSFRNWHIFVCSSSNTIPSFMRTYYSSTWNSTTSKMASLPQKKYYRQRAHSNPIADHCFD